MAVHFGKCHNMRSADDSPCLSWAIRVLKRCLVRRVLTVLSIVITCVVAGSASGSPGPQPVATLDLSRLLSPRALSVWSIAFVSDTSIAVGICRRRPDTGCSLSLIRLEDQVLAPYASTPQFSPGMSIHPSSGGQILTTPVGMSPSVLFSADLSVAQYLPSLHLVSRSGNTAVERSGHTAAERKKGTWKIYRVSPKMEFIREGTEEMEDISDEVVVLREDDVIRTETFDGKLLGYFSARPRAKCYGSAHLVSNDRLYLADCKGTRVVDFNGKEELQLHRPKGWGGLAWSGDAKRMLSDNFSRQISIFRSAGEIFVAFATLGMGVSDEQNNREEVRVWDTPAGVSCFDWKRSFPEGSEGFDRGHAAISRSGELVAIAAEGTLSVYRLPAACEGGR